MRAAVIIVALASMALSGCTVRLYGNQSTSGGATTTTTSSAVSGSTRIGNARVGISSGQPAPPSAQGGFLKLSGDAAAVLVVGLVLVDAVNYLTKQFSAAPAGPAIQRLPTDAISQTCSCYGYTGGPAPAAQRPARNSLESSQ